MAMCKFENETPNLNHIKYIVMKTLGKVWFIKNNWLCTSTVNRIDLKFGTKFGVKDHYLENYPMILGNIMNKKNVNLLQSIPRHHL